jgi:hypothetical protein
MAVCRGGAAETQAARASGTIRTPKRIALRIGDELGAGAADIEGDLPFLFLASKAGA